jgi:crotonobetainyl-CoA:carnitine CoA-transferase CaiB-like acyl-CoA transferase
VAILAALRHRDATGHGAWLDLALADCAMAWATTRGGRNQLIRSEERRHLFPSNDLFTCADGRRIALGVVEERFWVGLCAATAHLEPRLNSGRFASDADRRANGDELSEILKTLFLRDTAAAWEELLSRHDVPIQRVLDLAEAMETEQARARGLVDCLEGQRHMRFPALWNGEPAGVLRCNSPSLGADADTCLN